MTESPEDHPVISGRDETHAAIYLIWVLVFALGGIVVLFSAAGPACACTNAPDLVVMNRSSSPAHIEWHVGDGIFGTGLLRWGGQIDAPACRATTWELSNGTVGTTTTVGTQTRDLTIEVVNSGGSPPGGWILISADEQITGATWGSSPDIPPDGAILCP
ncbi:MAG: hypothetical protein U0838_00340 [Chloroflexota bacterium]